MADDDDHRAGFARRPTFLADEVAVFAGVDEDGERLVVVHLDAVRADIDPVAVGIFDDHQTLGADIPAAVVLRANAAPETRARRRRRRG